MNNIQTLHSHTKNSDGEGTHLDLLNTCEKNGISTIAFTDHDTLIDADNLEKLKNYEGKTKWISGIELSSGWPKVLGGGPTSNLHIVGLFVDPTNPELTKHCRLAKETRISRMQKIVGGLQGLGFEITEEKCLEASGGESVGRPHIVSALTSNPKNIEILEKLRLKMADEAKTNPEVKEKYDAMMEQGERQYPYVILLTDDAYIPGIYRSDFQYFVDMDASVKLIRDAGGVALLAHYFTCAKKIDSEMLERLFKDDRLDGAETVFGFFAWNTNSEIEKTVSETEKTAKSLIKKYNKLESGGVDVHKLQQLIDFSKTPDYAKRTVGFAEKIIDNSNVDLQWSNFN